MLKRIQVDCIFDKYYLSKQRKQNEAFSKKIPLADFSYYHCPWGNKKNSLPLTVTERWPFPEQENSAKLHDYLK